MPDAETRGVVYAATGDTYVTLARRAARTFRRVDPTLPIDLFTDAEVVDPVFDRIHRLDRATVRPKMEALRRSRFDRTLYLDADTILVAPIGDVLDLLDRFDVALTAEQRRGDLRTRRQLDGREVPTAFPQLNSGVVALRKSPATLALLDEWERWSHDGAQSFDQHSLRVLLYESGLRLHTLPAEYNVIWFRPFLKSGKGTCAPRLLHQPFLHREPPGDPEVPLAVGEALTPVQMEALRRLLEDDQTIGSYLLDGAEGQLRPRRQKLRMLHRWLEWRRKRI